MFLEYSFVELIFLLLCCHFIGDYVLQLDFIAKSKKDNLYHMIVHCVLYGFPFYFYFGFDWRLLLIVPLHFIVDELKVNDIIDYTQDQAIHLILLIIYIVGEYYL